MASPSRKSGAVLRGILLGVAASALAGAGHLAGLDRWAELKALDLRFRYLPTLAAGDEFVHVDLDDKALEQVGRWPWPRRRLAQLVDALNECGASAIALDIILPYPQEPRFVKEGDTNLYSADPGELLHDAPPTPVLDDVELADAIARNPNLFLAMHVDIVDPSLPASPRRRLQERVESLAASRPAITREQLRAELGEPPGASDELLVPAKEQALNRRLRDMLGDDPALPLRKAADELTGGAAPGSEDFDILRRCYLRQRALGVMKRFAFDEAGFASAELPSAHTVPPLVTLAGVMKHTGFVTITPDADGVVRRVPLLVRSESGVFPQLGLALALHVLGQRHGGIAAGEIRPGRIVIGCGDGSTHAIPLDEEGRLLINWAQADAQHNIGKHISAVAAASLWQGREQMRHNHALYRAACMRLAELLKGPGVDEPRLIRLVRQEDQTFQALHRWQVARQSALLFDPAAVPATPDDLLRRDADIEQQIDRECGELVETADMLARQAPTTMPADAAQAGQLRQLNELRAMIHSARGSNAEIEQRLADAKARLRQEIEGKICLVGSTATAAADFVPTPFYGRTPGVAIHANVLNTILSGKYVRTQRPWLAALMVLLMGAMVTLVSSTRAPIESAVLLLAAIAGYAVIDGTVWRTRTYWLVTVGPIAAMFFVFAVVTVYRQLTEERHRRQITSTFKQYLSPAMVDRLVTDPSQASLGGQRRQLSCLFSDLAGFTSISERLGPERTVNLLNRFLDRAGEVLQGRHGGTLSKYEGDGIFAFFGAPIPQPDHAARAIRAALDCQAFLPDFNRLLRQEGLLPEGAGLVMRIGITAGEVFVGNMGSTQRIAYTAIGDSVNLASRLETANKFFGTRILVNEAAWQAGAAGAVGRPIGKILVVGKSEPVSAWEPLAPAGADAGVVQLAEAFARGVELCAKGDFQAACDCFQRILTAHDDPASRAYLDLCQRLLSDPAFRADFNGVIRLTEK